MRHPAERFLRPLVLLAASSLLSWVAVEGLVRAIIGTPWPERLPLVRVQADPDLGWRMLPHDVHYTYDHRVRLNALGFRGPEVSQKREGELRILAIGDSHIYGQGIQEGALLTDVMRQELAQAEPDRPVTIVNMGVRGYNVNQEVALLGKVGGGLRPDHVIVFFYINDFEPVDVGRQYRNFKNLPWYTFDLQGLPEGDRLERWRQRQLLRKSALIMWAYDRYQAMNASDGAEAQILRGSGAESLERSSEYVSGQLRALARLATEHRFECTVAVIPVADQLAVDAPVESYQSRIGRLARKSGLRFFDLLPGMRAAYRQSRRLPIIPFDGHYDATAQREMGTLAARYLREQGRSGRLSARLPTPHQARPQ